MPVKIGSLTVEIHAEFRPPKKVRTREQAEAYAEANGSCLSWCHCELYMCAMRDKHGGPFHAFPEHRCDEGLKNVRAALDDAAVRDSPTFEQEILGKWDNEALRKQLGDIFGKG